MTEAPINEGARDDQRQLVRPRRVRRRRWTLVALFAVVFLSGMVAGGAVTMGVVTNRFHFRSKDPHAIPQRMARHMQRKLDLTDQQTQQVQAILTRRFESLMTLHRQLRPHIEAQFRGAQEEVAQCLTPEQAQQWRRWCTLRFHKHWPPPPGRRCPE